MHSSRTRRPAGTPAGRGPAPARRRSAGLAAGAGTGAERLADAPLEHDDGQRHERVEDSPQRAAASARLTRCLPANEAAGHAGVARPAAGEPSRNAGLAQLPVHSGLRWTSALPPAGDTRRLTVAPGS